MSYKIIEHIDLDQMSLRDAIVDTLIEEAQNNPCIVVGDADLMSASGLDRFQQQFPDRAFNFGIMEAHMASSAAGLSIAGFIPFIHSFSVFNSRRNFDQVTISGAYAGNSITLWGTDPGITAQYNGGTHNGLEDIGLYRTLPNVLIFDVCDSTQAKAIIQYRIEHSEGLCYIRSARNIFPKIYDSNSKFTPGIFPVVRQGKDVALFASGITVSEAIKASYILSQENISVRVIDCFTPSHMDINTIVQAAEECSLLIALDNHSIRGGVASAVADVLVEHCPKKLHRIGIENFGEVGSFTYLIKKHGLDSESIVRKIRMFL